MERGLALRGMRLSYAVGLVALASACNGSELHLGAVDAAPASTSEAAVAESLACPPIDEAQYLVLRGTTCAGVCTDGLGAPRALASPDEVAAALAGRWTFCSSTLGPADVVGIELDPGCVVYLLRADASGALVRGADARYQGTFDVVTRGASVEGIALHLATGDLRADVSASGCLGRARLAFIDGGTLDLASLDSLDASTPPAM
jgi:hypothetical protein